MILGSFFRGRAPQLIMFTVLIVAPVVTAVCAWGFGLWAAVIVEATAIFCASLAKLGQDSIVGREIGDEIRSSTFAVSETLNQVANVAGGLAGVLVSMLNNGQAGLGIAAGGLAVAVVLLVVRRRQRVVQPRNEVPPQGFRRGQPGRLDGGIDASAAAGTERDPEPAGHRDRGHHHWLGRRDRVAGRRARAEQHPGGPAERGEQHGFHEELRPDLPAGGAERAAQPDLAAALEHRDHHDVGDPDAADPRRYAAEREEQPGERAPRGRPRRQDAGRRAQPHALRAGRVRGEPEHVADRPHLVRKNAQVKLGRVAAERRAARWRRGTRRARPRRSPARAVPARRMPITVKYLPPR